MTHIPNRVHFLIEENHITHAISVSRFWCVQWFGAMTDVLSGMKHSEGQTSQEVTRGQKASNWSKAKTSTIYSTDASQTSSNQNDIDKAMPFKKLETSSSCGTLFSLKIGITV